MRRIFGFLAVVLAGAALGCALPSPADQENGRREKQPGIITLSLSLGGAGAGLSRTIAPEARTVTQFVVRVEDASGNLDSAYPAAITVTPTAGNAAELPLALTQANTGLKLVVEAQLAEGGPLSGSHQLVEDDFITGEIVIMFGEAGMGSILLPVAFPALLLVDAVHAELTKFDDTADPPFYQTQDLTPVAADVSNQQVTVSFPGLSAAGNYRLRLDFKRAGMVIKTINEAVIVEEGFVSNRWSAHDGSGWQTTRTLAAADFPGADPSFTLTVKSAGTALSLYADTDHPENLSILLPDITSPAAANLELSVALSMGASFTAERGGTDITASFSYAEAPAVYRAALIGENLESGSWELRLTGTAADGVAVKTYTLRPARFERRAGAARSYHLTLAGAVAASTGSASSPDVITPLSDILLGTYDTVTIPSGKYIKLISPAGFSVRTLKRAAGNTGNALITVNGELTLENIILDGGAVWSGGSATPPSPVFDATNDTGAGGASASTSLVKVNGTLAKLTLETGVKIQNSENYYSGGTVNVSNYGSLTINGGEISGNSAKSGSGVFSETNGSLTINGGVISGNRASNSDGGGVYATANTTFVMNGGEISGNSARLSGGGVDTAGTFTMNGGVISGNKITYTGGGGGGVCLRNGSFTMTAGVISGNTSFVRGGGIDISYGTFIMTGGVISGNTAATFGNGVHHTGPGGFQMSGAAQVTADNDVYLPNGKIIEITGNLTVPLPDYAAIITPASYAAGTAALSGSIGTNNTRFGVTPSGGASYTINSSGALESLGIVPANTLYWLGGESGGYTSATGSLLIPAGKTAEVFMVGGGGGGNAAVYGDALVRGGGGGEVKYLNGVGPGFYNYEIGEGGIGAAPWVGPEQAGGATTFGPYTAAGGAGGSTLPIVAAPGANGTTNPLVSFLSGLTLGSYTLNTTLYYGAEGGNIHLVAFGPPRIIDVYNPGSTGGGAAADGNGSASVTAGSGTFYGAGGGAAEAAASAGSGFKGVIFVKLN